MPNKLNLLLATVALWFGSGCFPYRLTTSPGASGVVVDAQTGTPISGAWVSVRPLPLSGTDIRSGTNSGPGGAFRIATTRQWAFYLFPADMFSAPFALSVTNQGYQSALVPFRYKLAFKPVATNFGEVRLERSLK